MVGSGGERDRDKAGGCASLFPTVGPILLNAHTPSVGLAETWDGITIKNTISTAVRYESVHTRPREKTRVRFIQGFNNG